MDQTLQDQYDQIHNILKSIVAIHNAIHPEQQTSVFGALTYLITKDHNEQKNSPGDPS